MALSKVSIMKNEEVQQRFDNLEHSIHHERREDRISMDKLTDAVSTLTATMLVFQEVRTSVERRLEINERETKELSKTISELKVKLSSLEPVIKSNEKGKEAQAAFYFRIFEKVALFGILGNIVYKLKGG